MGNWFSRGNDYIKVQEDISEIDNLLNDSDNRLSIYDDNRLSIYETDVIICKSKLYDNEDLKYI